MSNVGKYKILLVEDSKIAQLGAELNLTQFGCEVDIAETGTEAIKLIDKKVYDLIFMDLGLPDMDGIAVTQIIRNMEEPTNKILIIALTAHFNNEIKESCRQAGMDDFIEKPIGHKTTQKILEKYLKNKDKKRKL